MKTTQKVTLLHVSPYSVVHNALMMNLQLFFLNLPVVLVKYF